MRTIILLLILIINSSVFASEEQLTNNNQTEKKQTQELANNKKDDENPEYQKIIDEYRKFLQSVPQNVREEVVEYRIQNAKINNEKKKLYKSLSIEAQKFLKTEQEYKRKLPIKLKKDLNKENKPEDKNQAK